MQQKPEPSTEEYNDHKVVDLALKFNNTCSGTNCHICNCHLRPEVGYQITLRDTFDFVCDKCATLIAPELIIARESMPVMLPSNLWHFARKTTIGVGDRITIRHPKDDKERTGTVVNIGHMSERDDVFVQLGVGNCILMVVPGTKRKAE